MNFQRSTLAIVTLAIILSENVFAADSLPYPSPIDAPFRGLFSDATTMIKVEAKERQNIFTVISSIGSGKYTEYELTFSDALNKITAVYSSYGDLLQTNTFKKSCERLPEFLQRAIAEKAGAIDGGTVLDIKAAYDSPDRCLFKISGKSNGRKFNVEIPNTRQKIHPEAHSLAVHRTVNVFHDGDMATEYNTVNLSALNSTPYSAKFTYAWKQTEGEDLKLPAEDLIKRDLKFAVRKAGTYRFQLTVNDGNEISAPTEVAVQVEEKKAEIIDGSGK